MRMLHYKERTQEYIIMSEPVRRAFEMFVIQSYQEFVKARLEKNPDFNPMECGLGVYLNQVKTEIVAPGKVKVTFHYGDFQESRDCVVEYKERYTEEDFTVPCIIREGLCSMVSARIHEHVLEWKLGFLNDTKLEELTFSWLANNIIATMYIELGYRDNVYCLSCYGEMGPYYSGDLRVYPGEYGSIYESFKKGIKKVLPMMQLFPKK